MEGNIFKDTMTELSWIEIDALAKNDAVVLFPVGVIEEHGPQLPLGTDIYLAYAQAHDVWEVLSEQEIPCVIAPPFFWGGIRAITKEFPGSFPCRKELVTEMIKDILGSLKRSGFSKVVLFNNHGDGEHITAILDAVKQSREMYDIQAYWIEYEDDLEQRGFNGKEDYLLPLTPVPFEEFFTCEKEIVDSFDIHAGAFETAGMRECFPQFVKEELLEGLEPSMLKGEQQMRFGFGKKEDCEIIPNGYCGDPRGSINIKTSFKKIDRMIAEDIVRYLYKE